MEVHKIVIVGAGFGGLRTALELAKRRVRLKTFEITLIDRNADHVYTPLLYEVSSGELDVQSKACVGELRSGVCVRFDSYVNIVKKKNIRFRRAEVAGIDRERKTVRLADGETIPYDDLVVAVGVETADYGIPGVKEHALPMKTLKDGFHIRERVHGMLQTYKDGDRRTGMRLVVVGGGATGVEFAAETANFLRRLEREGIVQAGDVNICLVEAGPDILMMFSPALRAKARERLAKLGVTVRTETKLKEVGAHEVSCEGKGGPETHAADVVVWTAGIRPLAAAKEWGLPVDERGFIAVDKTLAVEGVKNVHALGDCVTFLHPKTKARVPALAQAAVKQAGIVAENVARHLERKLPMSWNPPERWVTVVPMGGTYAIADFGWFRLCDGLGYMLRKATDLSYFLSILPPREAWKMWREGSKVYYKND